MEVSVHFAPRRFEMLTEMLFKVLEEVAPPNVSEIAEQVGRTYGRELAAEIGAPNDPGYDEAVQAVASAMTGLGFSVDPDVEGQRLLTSHCPFGETATNHPDVICSLDRGIVAGLFGALSVPCNPVVFPHQGLDDDCVTQVPVTIGG
jgi:predicted ArsR family transcriptional regulator